MSIGEIINRDSKVSFEISELIYVVEEYIYKRKGRKVVINLQKPFHSINPLFYQDQVVKLNVAFNTALVWFKENGHGA